MTMTFNTRTFTLVLTLLAGFILSETALNRGAASVLAFSERNRHFSGTKDCTTFTGAPGSYCSISDSNLAKIPIGSNLYYDQPTPTPLSDGMSFLLDSNVALDAGNGNRAVGRCTLDFTTALGLCTFSDGTGELAGFHARINVDCTAGPAACRLEGTYSFNSDEGK
jgi:hypothetical protein